MLCTVFIAFMVSGHSKFGPDKLAQPIATVFNSATLLRCASACSSPQLYHSSTLYLWKRCSHDLFGPVDNIMSYRQFLVVQEDDEVNVGPEAELPEGMEAFPGASAPTRHHPYLMAAASNLASRSLRKLIPEVISRTRQGGIGRATLPECPDRLQPKSVASFRRVRMFMRRNESESVWREQVGWMKAVSLSEVNSALAKVVPYSSTPGMGREFYGAKLKGVKDQFTKFVPPMHVDDSEDNLRMVSLLAWTFSVHRRVLATSLFRPCLL